MGNLITDKKSREAQQLKKLLGLLYPDVCADKCLDGLNKMVLGWQASWKKKFLVKSGPRMFQIDVSDIAYFLADNKIVYLITADASRYVIHQTLELLEKELDPALFFRINRSVIVRMPSIRHIRPYTSNRIKLVIQTESDLVDEIVSRGRVGAFRSWMSRQS